MEIEVGEYIRIKDGINKIKDINYCDDYPDSFYEYELKSYPYFIYDEDIVNHSKNIIDLIEVGDYVNGYKVINVIIDPAPSGKCVDIDSNRQSEECTIWEEDIKSVLTKEQYNQNCYRLEE